MANKEISELTSKATPVGTDEIEIQETGAGLSKKTTLQAVLDSVTFSDIDVDGGTIDGAVIGGTTPAAASVTTLDASGLADTSSLRATGISVAGSGAGVELLYSTSGGNGILQAFDRSSSSHKPLNIAGAGVLTTIKGSFQVDEDATFGGNAAFSSGNGIDFSATADGSGTTTSELFDDYEEGTWTSTWTDFSNSGAEGQTHDVQVGRYTKAGDMVSAWFRCRLTGKGSLNSTDGARITGLPFPANSGTNVYGTVSVGFCNGLSITSGTPISGLVASSQSYVELYQGNATTGSPNTLKISNLSASADLIGVAHYKSN